MFPLNNPILYYQYNLKDRQNQTENLLNIVNTYEYIIFYAILFISYYQSMTCTISKTVLSVLLCGVFWKGEYMKKTIVILMILMIVGLGIMGCTTTSAYTDISVVDAKDLIDSTPDIIIIDVSPVYADGHLPNAVSYPLGDGSLDDAIPMLDMDVTYLVYCHTDAASMEGAQKLIDAGFENVYRLEGNYAAWVDAGYMIEGAYMDISVMDSKVLIDSMADIIIIDVSPVYADGHLPNAVSYPLGDGSLDNAIPMLDMDMTYLVYCHTDEASMAGAQKLVDAGFKVVYRLEGNYAAWVDAGYMIEK